jgi:hypothetical protein
MAQERNKKRKDVPDLTIFQEEKKAKITAKKTLEVAKEQETKKLNDGFAYFLLADGKTRVLRKTN